MNIPQRIKAFVKLGEYISAWICAPCSHEEFDIVIQKAEHQNPWFTKDNSKKALLSIASFLNETKLYEWLQAYTIPENQEKKVAVIMAGNIPLVGFHDALCVLITGNTLLAKVSSKDSLLISFLFEKLIAIEPQFKHHITITNSIISGFDAIISTGSNNSSRYFEYYFQKHPHIIRKNRNSVAVLLGNETEQDLQNLGADIFDYFGLGCRNVSKLYIPNDYNIETCLNAFQSYNHVCMHNKYMNNYEYQKSIYLVCQHAHFDNGFMLLKEDSNISSPVAVVYFEKYNSLSEVQTQLALMHEQIQCIVCKEQAFSMPSVEPGYTQSPTLTDYADNIDTISFIIHL